MPANDGFVCTCESQFVGRKFPTGDLTAGPETVRIVRILQQRWVRVGTMSGDPLTETNSEWRDVPYVEEG